MSSEKLVLVYDKQCPVCHAYCQNVRVTGTAGELSIVDARAESGIRREITSRGLDIDQGMVLLKRGQLYYGADAIHQLSLLGDDTNLFNRINYRVFQSAGRSRWLYPVLRSFRNLLLKILGRTKINNLGTAGNEFF
jgi:predicted DCC family thiol-disulfide oxidoreductase YuxK